MKKEIADLWVQALRSGKYSQVKAVLHKPGEGHCCLGVLCELSEQGEWHDPLPPLYGSDFVCLGASSAQLLPGPVQKWAGIETGCVPEVDLPGHELAVDRSNGRNSVALSQLNDAGYTFAQIADVIEQHWEKL